MTREEFKKSVEDAIQLYIDNFYRFDSNPQVRVNPTTLSVELVNGADILAGIGDNDEAIEAAAASHGMANQEAADFQVSLNPDYYAVKPMLEATPDGGTKAKSESVDFIVNTYF